MPLGTALHLGDRGSGGDDDTCPAQASSRQTLILIVPCVALWPGREAPGEWGPRQGVLPGRRGLRAACQGGETGVCPDIPARRLSAGNVLARPSRVLSTLPLLGHGHSHPSLELRGSEACGGKLALPAAKRPLWAERGRRMVLGQGATRPGRSPPTPSSRLLRSPAVFPGVGCGLPARLTWRWGHVCQPLGCWCVCGFFNILITME